MLDHFSMHACLVQLKNWLLLSTCRQATALNNLGCGQTSLRAELVQIVIISWWKLLDYTHDRVFFLYVYFSRSQI